VLDDISRGEITTLKYEIKQMFNNKGIAHVTLETDICGDQDCY
jgi:hypothetical protein